MKLPRDLFIITLSFLERGHVQKVFWRYFKLKMKQEFLLVDYEKTLNGVFKLHQRALDDYHTALYRIWEYSQFWSIKGFNGCEDIWMSSDVMKVYQSKIPIRDIIGIAQDGAVYLREYTPEVYSSNDGVYYESSCSDDSDYSQPPKENTQKVKRKKVEKTKTKKRLRRTGPKYLS
jgi:hypothetical protein